MNVKYNSVETDSIHNIVIIDETETEYLNNASTE